MKNILPIVGYFMVAHTAIGQLTHFEASGYTGLPINGGGCWEVIPYDIDEDNDLDIIVLRAHEFDEIYINDGQGKFTLRSNLDAWQIQGGTFSYAKADLNKDGKDDLILGRGPASGSSSISNGRDMLLIYDDNNDDFVEASLNLPADELATCFVPFRTDTTNYTMGVATGDFNKDGIPDIVMANGGIIYQIHIEPIKPFSINGGGQWYTPPFCVNFRNKLLENNVYLGKPDNSVSGMPVDGVYDYVNFSDSSGIGQYVDVSTDVVVGDFNMDGWDDIFITNFHHEPLRDLIIGNDLPLESGYSKLFINDTTNPGHFTWEQTLFPQTLYPATSVDAGDFDKDGDLDLFITMESRAKDTWLTKYDIQPKLFLNDGTGKFTEDVTGKIPVLTNDEQKSLYDANFADINGDGWLDIFCGGVQNVLFIQDTTTHKFIDKTNNLPLQNSSLHPYTFHAYGSNVNDYNGDGLMDVIMVDTYEQNRLQVQGSNQLFKDVTTTNLPPDGENNTDVAIGDLDNDNDLDIVCSIYEDGNHLQGVHIQNGSMNDYPLFEDLSGIFASGNAKSSDRGVEMLDVDGDDLPEVLFTGYNKTNRYYKNNGSLSFSNVTATIFPDLNNYTYINKAKMDVLNNDNDVVVFLPNGAVDAVSNGGIPEANALYRWNGSKFVNTNWIPTDVKVTTTVDFEDLNNDGWKDILVVNEDDKMDIYMSQNPSSTNPNYSSVIPSAFEFNHSIDARFVDLEGDGDWDIVENSSCCAITNNDTNYFTVYLNEGTFTGNTPDYSRITFGHPAHQASSLDVLDFNWDGLMDVVISDRDSLWFFKWDSTLVNMVDVTSLYTNINEVSGIALSTLGMKAADVNEDGLMDVYIARDNQDVLLYGQGTPVIVPSVNEFQREQKLRVYPNPASNAIFLQMENFPNDHNVDIKLYSTDGRMVRRVKKYRVGEEINISNLDAGMYHIQVQVQGVLFYGKFMKVKN